MKYYSIEICVEVESFRICQDATTGLERTRSQRQRWECRRNLGFRAYPFKEKLLSSPALIPAQFVRKGRTDLRWPS